MSERQMDSELGVLAGFMTFREFFALIKTRTTDGQSADDMEIAARWRRARAYISTLEAKKRHQYGLADVDPLPPNLLNAAQAALNEPARVRCSGYVSAEWSWVDLERITAVQCTLNRSYVQQLQRQLSAAPSAEELLRAATGSLFPRPEVSGVITRRDSYSFTSASSDLRIVGTAILDPKDVKGFSPYGHAGAVLSVFIGYGPNMISAVHWNGRLVLSDGTHRAVALLQHGIRDAPCLIYKPTHDEELDMLGLAGMRGPFDRCVRLQRPPTLRDFLDSEICHVYELQRRTHVVEVDLDIRVAGHAAL